MSFSVILNTDFHQLWEPGVWVTGTELPLADSLPREGGPVPQVLFLGSQQTAPGMVVCLQT